MSNKNDIDTIFEYSIDMKTIADKISNENEDLCCIFSPNYIGEIDIFVDISDIEIPEDNEFIKNNYINIYLDEVVSNNISSILI